MWCASRLGVAVVVAFVCGVGLVQPHQRETRQVDPQNQDLEALKTLILQEPSLRPNCFIVTWPDCTHCNHDAVDRSLKTVYGSDLIKSTELMGYNLVLVSVNDPAKRDDMLASVRQIRNPHNSNVYFDVVSATSVPARIEISITGIPFLLISAKQAEFLAALNEALSFLSNFTVDNSKLPNASNKGVTVEGLTNDLEKTKAQLEAACCKVTFRGLTGEIRYQSAGPVIENNIKLGGRKGVEYKGW